MAKTISQVQEAFLNRKSAKTKNLHADESGRLWSYGWYEIARWVRQCRLHQNNCPDLGNPNSECCPAARTRLLVRKHDNLRQSWYSRSMARHARSIQNSPDAQLAQEPTPSNEGSMRL